MRKHRTDWPYTIPAGPGPVARTYQLEHQTLVRLIKQAKALDCYPSHLVEALLVHGLDGIEAGALVVDKQPIVFAVKVRSNRGSPDHPRGD